MRKEPRGPCPKIRHLEELVSELDLAHQDDRLEEFCRDIDSEKISKMTNASKQSALSLAIADRLHIDAINALIVTVGVDVNFGGPPSPLELAATTNRSNQVDLVKLLIDRGAELDDRDETDRTILVKTLLGGGENRKDIARLLIRSVANVDLHDSDGNSVFAITCRLARETGDPDYRALANEIVTSSRDRVERTFRHPTGEKWTNISNEWCNNLDLLDTPVLERIYDSRQLPGQNAELVAAEIQARETLITPPATIDRLHNLSPSGSPINFLAINVESQQEKGENESRENSLG